MKITFENKSKEYENDPLTFSHECGVDLEEFIWAASDDTLDRFIDDFVDTFKKEVKRQWRERRQSKIF